MTRQGFFMGIVWLICSIPMQAQDLTIHNAACDGNIAAMDSLLATVDINLQNGTESTPLQLAAFCRQSEAFHFLIKKGADVNILNRFQETALYYAIRARDSSMVASLLEKGAIVNMVNGENRTPIFRAVQFGQEGILDMLIQAGGDVNLGESPMHEAVLFEELHILKKLINEETEIDPLNNYENTPLAIAQRQGSTEVIDFLISKGADPKKVKSFNLRGDYVGQPLPGSEAVIFAKGFISTENFNHTPAFNPDQTEVYYTLESQLAHGGTIMVSRLIDGKWKAPEPSPIEGDFREIDPFITSDGTKMYYSSNRPVNGKEDPNNIDLWMVHIDGDTWSDPIHLGEDVNTEYLDWFPTVSDKGNLFFSTGPNASSNIVYSEFKDGKFQKAISLGDSVNSEARDYDPLIAPDESFVMFSSNRPGGIGSVDIYISFRQPDGSWGKAKNMGPTVNTTGGEFAPKLSADGKYLFFNRGGEIYWRDARIIEELKND